MESSNKGKLTLLLLSTLLLSGKFFCQDFKISPLITIPGDNRNFSIASPLIDVQSHNSFICWENRLGSKYTIYLKQIDPFEDSIYTVWSDTIPNTSPVISYRSQDTSVNIVWQSCKNTNKVLYIRNFKNKGFNRAYILTDTLKNSINPSLSEGALVWINDGKLLYRALSSEISGVMEVDSINCENPVIYPIDSRMDPLVLYEKGEIGNRQIYYARYIGQIREQKPYWEITKVSDGTDNINPSFAPFREITYQTKIDSLWKIVWSYPSSFYLDKYLNGFCNFERPSIFNYPKYTGNTANNALPYFLVFDSDSIRSNREIFISYNYMYRFADQNIVNFSNSPGDDIKPKVAYFNHSQYIHPAGLNAIACIAWEHIENNKSDIWWAVSPCWTPMNVEDNSIINKFRLSQNFPNPFNPSTTISYSIPVNGFVKLTVFDILGNQIALLVNEYKSAGSYKASFNGNSLPSGIYLYKLQSGNFSETKKFVLLK